MKKILFLGILIAGMTHSYSQNLSGTTWLGTDPPSPNLWFQFGPDTLYYSFGSGGYTPISLYTASAGVFAVFDLPGASLCSDTGHYNYSIVGNNLVFTLVGDNCSSRRNTLLNYTWFLLSTGITGLPPQQEFSAYPNPASEGMFTLIVPDIVSCPMEVVLFDLSGKMVYHAKLESTETCIDIRSLPHGMYAGYIWSGSARKAFKIAR